MLYVAFDTPDRMPITRWKLQLAAAGEEQIAEEGVLVAELGSLALEFTRLSQITRDPQWYDATQRIMKAFAEQQNQTNVPGMWPLVVNPRDLDLASGTVFTLDAMSDSLDEYLPKMIALLGGSDMYESMYRDAMSAAIEHTLYRPMLPDVPDVLVAGSAHADAKDEARLESQGQHLVCFAGGMLALGGRLMQDPTHVSLGRKVTEGCTWAYQHCPLGIMPETFTMLPCDKLTCAWSESDWHAGVVSRAGDGGTDAAGIIEARRLPTGFTSMDDRRYIFRPEAIESVFILYRITGDQELQEVAWKMWQSIDKHTKTDIANAAIMDMSDPNAPKSDSMESFWTAETLKYFYLIFSDPSLISLDDYVFNTEAHPFKRPHTR
jgi:mannosyl-oligosaccharide alpha-1,2-mannosidase